MVVILPVWMNYLPLLYPGQGISMVIKNPGFLQGQNQASFAELSWNKGIKPYTFCGTSTLYFSYLKMDIYYQTFFGKLTSKDEH